MKNLLPIILMLVLVFSCEKETYNDIVQDNIEQDDLNLDGSFEIETRGVVKYTLCHYDQELETYNKLSLPEQGLNNHLNNHSMDRVPGETVTIDDVIYELDDDCILVEAEPTYILIDEFTMTFTSYYSHTSPVLESSKEYFMTIDGKYYIAHPGGKLDGAFYYCYYPCAIAGDCDSNTPCPDLLDNSFITSMRPIIDDYSQTNFYEYEFEGNDEGMLFEFSDCCYGDNGGALNIKIYEVSYN